MKAIPDGAVDAVITDPPYGIKASAFRENNVGKLALTRDYGDFSWDEKVPQFGIDEIRRVSRTQVIFGGNYYANWLPPSRGWFVWDKQMPDGCRFADCELAWTNLDCAVRKIEWLWNGMIRKHGEERFHPTQKPLGVMVWCIQRAGLPETILDPFLGSGTTAVAAKKLGRHFVGFEISPEYCKIAEERIRLVEMQPKLFEPRPEQANLKLEI